MFITDKSKSAALMNRHGIFTISLRLMGCRTLLNYVGLDAYFCLMIRFPIFSLAFYCVFHPPFASILIIGNVQDLLLLIATGNDFDLLDPL